MRVHSVKLCWAGVPLLCLCAHSATFAKAPELYSPSEATSVSRTTQWVQLRDGTRQNISVEQHPEFNVFEGDVLVARPTSNTATPTRGLAVAPMGQLWPGGVIPYDIATGMSAALQQVVYDAIRHWQARSNIRFVPRNVHNQAQYRDFVRFTASSFGCASYIGRQGWMQEIYLNSSCSTGNIIHEIGHAVGLYHEHTRADRDQYVRIMEQNIRPDRLYNFQSLNTSAVRPLGGYDLDSVMHYGAYFFSRNGQPTIMPHDGNLHRIGQRHGLSQGDLSAVAALYGVDVGLSLKADQSLVPPRGEVTLSYYVSNLSPSTTGPLGLSLHYPNGTQLKALYSAGTGWICNTASNPILCQRSSLPGEALSHLRLRFQAPEIGNPLTFSAQVNGGPGDGNDSNNADTAEVVVNSQNFRPYIEPNQKLMITLPARDGDFIGQLSAKDPNQDTLSYSLFRSVSSRAFSLDTDGQLRVKDSALLSAQNNRTITLYVSVSDGQVGSSQTPFQVHINDAHSLRVSGGAEVALPNATTQAQPQGGSGGSTLALCTLVLWPSFRRLASIRKILR